MAASPGEATLLIAGDTNLQFREHPAGAFRHVRPLFEAADVRFVNLEGPLAGPSEDPAQPDIPHKQGWRHSEPRMVAGLVAARIDAAGCANNVTYPPAAMLRSLRVLDEAGIAHCGAGHTGAEARQPVLLERNGVRFAFLAYTSVFWPVGHAAGRDTPGVATIRAHTAYQPNPRIAEMPGGLPTVVTWPDEAQLAALRADVGAARQQADVVVVSCHWGVSGSSQTCDYQRAIGKEAVAAGADVVAGHGPHVLQGVEVVRGRDGGRPVFYSLANFAFDWTSMRGRSLDGLLVRCNVRDRRLAEVAIVPVQRNGENDPVPLDPLAGEGRRITAAVEALSAPYGTRLHADEGGVVVPLSAGERE